MYPDGDSQRTSDFPCRRVEHAITVTTPESGRQPANLLPLPTLRTPFHPPDPPIALQSFTRDVRFTQLTHPPSAVSFHPPPTDCCAIVYRGRALCPSHPPA